MIAVTPRASATLVLELHEVSKCIAAQTSRLADYPSAPRADDLASSLEGARRLALSLAEAIRREAIGTP